MQNSTLTSEVNIVLLGRTGSGKSATGNTIIGGDRKPFEDDFSPESVTTDCTEAHTVVNGQTITVIDTIGLSDTSVKVTDAQTQIEQMLQGTNLDVFLLVIKLGQTFEENDCKVVQWIKNNFGEKALQHSTVLFTHGDQLHVSMDRYLSKSKMLRSVVHQCSGGSHVFNNKDKDRSQVTELLKEINKLRATDGYRRYTDQDYKETQNKILRKKYRTGATKGGGVGGVLGGAAGTAIAFKAGAVALTVVKVAVIGATGGAVVAAAAVGAGVYYFARKCIPR